MFVTAVNFIIRELANEVTETKDNAINSSRLMRTNEDKCSCRLNIFMPISVSQEQF
jgi:hypothetical protein